MATRRAWLARHRRRRGLSQEALAHLVDVDVTTVQRWESGRRKPQPWTRIPLAKALELTRSQLDRLLESDSLRPAPFVSASVDSRNRQGQLGSVGEITGAEPLHAEIISDMLAEAPSIPAVINELRRADNRFGGGHGLAVAVWYLKHHVEPMVRDAPSGPARTTLLGSAAELHHLVGWMAYDVGEPTNGKRHLREALALCREAGNLPFAAEMLAGMSHQASFARQAESAVDLALGAGLAARESSFGALRAEAAVLEAHGHAQLGNARECVVALTEAERVFVAPNDTTPQWLTYFDEAYLAAKMAHVLLDLGRPTDAERLARRSLDMSDGFDRGRMFNTALLAWALAALGDVDEAVRYAREAHALATAVRSARAREYVRRTLHSLAPFRGDPAVDDFLNAAARPARSAHGAARAVRPRR